MCSRSSSWTISATLTTWTTRAAVAALQEAPQGAPQEAPQGAPQETPYRAPKVSRPQATPIHHTKTEAAHEKMTFWITSCWQH